jgi:hypothetical protein
MLRQSVQAKEYVQVPVTVVRSGVEVDPTADTVQMAFPVAGQDPAVWNAAIWDSDPTTTPDDFFAACLVGPGGTIALATGHYDIWLKVTPAVGPEIPVVKGDRLVIF